MTSSGLSGGADRPRCVVVALSGGVDSSVAAAVLLDQGITVVGVTLRMQALGPGASAPQCFGRDSIARAQAVAAQLGIAHHVIDCSAEFEVAVLRPAWEDYARGRTPSPCLRCNPHVKFGVLLAWARQVGADAIATGHYARVLPLEGGGFGLFRGIESGRDQSYFLAGLDRDSLSRILFPLGHLDKPAVRALADARGLPTAGTPDSQDACLSDPDLSFAEVLRRRFGAEARPGPVIDDAGRVLGRHSGIHTMTIGQRKGLGIASPGRLWVRQIRVEDAVVVVTDRPQALESRRLRVGAASWLADVPAVDPWPCQVQIRSRQVAQEATAQLRPDGGVTVSFAQPVRAAAPGQAAVFYQGNRVLGRGWIDAAE